MHPVQHVLGTEGFVLDSTMDCCWLKTHSGVCKSDVNLESETSFHASFCAVGCVVKVVSPHFVCFRSEIRLMEIVEGLCESSSFECNRMVEEHEEHFETWWFKRSGVIAIAVRRS